MPNSLLSDLAVRTAKPKEKTYLLRDGGGLWLAVESAGRKVYQVGHLRTVLVSVSHQINNGGLPP